MMPTQPEIELPLLATVQSLGGKGSPEKIYPLVSKSFPELTDADLEQQLDSGWDNKWKNRIRWVRQRLISKGELASPEPGIWAITAKGIERLRATQSPHKISSKTRPEIVVPAASFNLEEIAEDYSSAFRQRLIQNLLDSTPTQFEHFAALLLKAYGFGEVSVTQQSKDGGIDGHGKLKVGLANMHVAFQCKRWRDNVQRKQIDEFRGAVQGKYEQGYFFTTSDFSSGAKEVSIQKGAVTIVLVNGEAIAQLMIEKELGVRRRPIELYEDRVIALFETTTR